MPDGGIWLGLVDGIVAGCVAVRPLEAGRCEMKRLYLRPDARGTGLGRLLATAAISGAVERGYASIRLDTMPSMRSAIALYRSLGFQDIAAYCYNPVDDAVFLERRLG